MKTFKRKSGSDRPGQKSHRRVTQRIFAYDSIIYKQMHSINDARDFQVDWPTLAFKWTLMQLQDGNTIGLCASIHINVTSLS